jgi:hypothetical protein
MKSISIAVLLFAPGLLAAQQSSGMSAWRGDVKLIAERLPAIHPDAFYRMPKASWDSAVAALDSRLPSMTRNQAIAGLMQLVARVSDGHTAINPMYDGAMRLHAYPFELYQFDDGLFVKSAAPKYASIVGAKVLRFGKVSADSAIAAAITTIGHENDWFAREHAPGRLIFGEVIDGLGLVEDASRLTLTIEKAGRAQTVTLDSLVVFTPAGHNPNSGMSREGWVDMRGSATALWSKNQTMPYWWEFVPADGTLYVSYRGVISMDNPTNQQFWRGVFSAVDTLAVNRMVIDLRENQGGNSFYNRQVVRGIIARPKIDQQGKLFVIMSGRTFSAAMNLVQDLEAWTNVTFVGAPTGNATVFFGDHTQVVLPASGLTVNVSTLPWYPTDPRDRRNFIAPRIYTPMTSADYRSNVDPSMRAVLGRGTTPALASSMERAILSGDTATAERLAREATASTENRFYPPEGEINRLGYQLIDSNRTAAIQIFRINTKVFPRSANAWDSLGEALVLAGQRDAGIAAYRRAVELSPNMDSAKAALTRLGAGVR